MADVTSKGSHDRDDSRHGKDKHKHKHKKKKSSKHTKRSRSPDDHDTHRKKHKESADLPGNVGDNSGSSASAGGACHLDAFVYDADTMPTGDDFSQRGSDHDESPSTGTDTPRPDQPGGGSSHTLSSMMGFSGGQATNTHHSRPAPGPPHDNTNEMLHMALKDIDARLTGLEQRKRKHEHEMSTSDSSSDSSSSEDSDNETEPDHDVNPDDLDNVFSPKKKDPNNNDTSGDQSAFDKAMAQLGQFCAGEEESGPDINDSFAKSLNGILRKKPVDTSVTDVMKKYKKPANVKALKVPKTNSEVFDGMNKGPKVTDACVQKTQLMLSKALVPLIMTVNDIGIGKADELAPKLEPFMDVIRLTAGALSQLSQVRKDIIRNDLKYPMAKLCTWETPVGDDWLFGPDVVKKVKEKSEFKKLKPYFRRKSGKYNKGRRHGYGYNTYKKPFLGRRNRNNKRKSKKEKDED